MERIVLVKVRVDEDNIRNKYPNFNFNWNNAEEFIEETIDWIDTPDEEDGIPVNHYEKYGYDITVLTREEAKLMDVEINN